MYALHDVYSTFMSLSVSVVRITLQGPDGPFVIKDDLSWLIRKSATDTLAHPLKRPSSPPADDAPQNQKALQVPIKETNTIASQ